MAGRLVNALVIHNVALSTRVRDARVNVETPAVDVALIRFKPVKVMAPSDSVLATVLLKFNDPPMRAMGAASGIRLEFAAPAALVIVSVVFLPTVIGCVLAIEPFNPLNVRVDPAVVDRGMTEFRTVAPVYVFAPCRVRPAPVLNDCSCNPPAPLMTPVNVGVPVPASAPLPPATTRLLFAVMLLAIVTPDEKRSAPPLIVSTLAASPRARLLVPSWR